MVLRGEVVTTPGTLPTIIPELQNRSVISVVYGRNDLDYSSFLDVTTCFHFGALTSSGKLLAWGRDYSGGLGFGDRENLPPGGYPEGSQIRAHIRADVSPYQKTTPVDVTVPSEVRFDFKLRAGGRVERYCFATATGDHHTGALVIDLAGDKVPPGGLEQKI